MFIKFFKFIMLFNVYKSLFNLINNNKIIN